MTQFVIKENGFKEIRKLSLIRVIPIMILAMIVGIAMPEFSSNNTAHIDFSMYFFIVPILLVMLVFGLNKGVKRQKAIYDKYMLFIDENGITREQGNTASMKLLFSEITKITKNNQGGFVIVGKNFANSIIVPAQVENIEEFEKIINDNCTIPIERSKFVKQKLMIPIVITVLGLMSVIYISTNKIFVLSSGILLSIFMIWSFIRIHTNKNIDKKTRNSSCWVILVIFSIIGVVISKLVH